MSAATPRLVLEAARTYCETIDSRSTLDVDSFLIRVHADISELYAAVMSLRESDAAWADHGDWPARGDTHQAWAALYGDLRAKLGPLDRYREVFHPYEDEREPVVIGSLADGLADLHVAATHATRIAEEQSETAAALFLRLEFEIHAGHHALDAMRAMHMHRFAPIEPAQGSA